MSVLTVVQPSTEVPTEAVSDAPPFSSSRTGAPSWLVNGIVAMPPAKVGVAAPAAAVEVTPVEVTEPVDARLVAGAVRIATPVASRDCPIAFR